MNVNIYPIISAPQPSPFSIPISPPPHSKDTIIIDNGATTLRAGWASESEPRIIIENFGAKIKKSDQTILLIGNQAYLDAASKAAIKSPFDGEIVVHFDQMEIMLDFVFEKLGITTQSVNYPIIMTEPLGNPLYCRSTMTELLFENYSVPSLTYGVDSLFSFYQNSPISDGLVISSSTASTSVIPILNGQPILLNAKKIPWGGSQATEYILKLMQLKYPNFPGRLLTYQAAGMHKEHCYHSLNYGEENRSLSNPTNLIDSSRIIQFPFVEEVTEEKTQLEMDQIQKKKKEAGNRLQEMAARQRLETLVRQEEELMTFTELKQSGKTGRKTDYEKRLKAAGFRTANDLEDYLKKIEKALQKARNKELGVDENEGKEPPNFSLVDVPDASLNEEDLKEKRKQKMLKGAHDARARARAAKESAKILALEEKNRAEAQRLADPGAWLSSVQSKYATLLNNIKEKKKLKEQLSDRKSIAAQARMKSIASLAGEAPSVAGGGTKRKRPEKVDDFGQNDNDWAVYREIGNGEESDDEGETTGFINNLEHILLRHDPNFTLASTFAAMERKKHQLFNAFVRGIDPKDSRIFDPTDLEISSQLHLNVERIRVAEVIFQPSIAGLDQAGLIEVIGHVLNSFSLPDRDRLTKNIFITGSHTLLPGFDSRLRVDLQSILPADTPIILHRPRDIGNDSWRGMSKAARSNAVVYLSRSAYDRNGGEFLPIHSFLGRS